MKSFPSLKIEKLIMEKGLPFECSSMRTFNFQHTGSEILSFTFSGHRFNKIIKENN